MNRIERVAALLRERGECGIAPYVTAGDGGLGRTRRVLHALERAGAACVELGVPFSDPIADGPGLQAAAQRALDAGTTLDGILDLVRRYRDEGGALPILLFSYANPLLRHGAAATVERLAAAGADGLLVPDLPVEEGADLRTAALEAGLAPVAFVAPTTGDERIARAAELSRGFVYVIGRTGVTGARTELGRDAQELLERVRRSCDLPIAVGFGIATAGQVAAVARHAELAVVGTALVQRLHEAAAAAADPDAAAEMAAFAYLSSLRSGTLA